LKSERIALVMVGLLLGVATVGCRERNPAYIEKSEPRDGAVEPDAADDVFTAPDTASADASGPASDVPTSDGRTGNQDLVADTLKPTVDLAGSEAGPALADAADARDTRDARRTQDDVNDSTEVSRDVPILLDVPADGQPDAGAPDVADVAVDLPPACKDQDTRSCVSPSNPLLGACQAGKQTCTNGAWGTCVGEVLPAGSELCNGIDDTCNGLTDEGCTEDCVIVSPAGDDTTADGTLTHPYATVAAAAAFAVEVDGGPTKRVCVAGGATCGDSHVYASDASLVVPSGSRIHGNYAATDSGLVYCSTTSPPTTGLAFTATEQGIVFGASVTTPTELGNVSITRLTASSGSATTGAVSAVLVDGAKQVFLSGIFVTDAPVATVAYGVDIEHDGQATITGSAIGGGQGRTTAVGVYVNSGTVTLRGNCDKIVDGVCQSTCAGAGSILGIRGRVAVATGDAFTDSSAVLITGATSGASSIVGNLICGGPGNLAGQTRGASVAALRCESAGCSSIRGNVISGGLGKATVALALSSSSPQVDGNLIVGGCGLDTTVAVLAEASGMKLVNNRIFGGQCTGNNASGNFLGVRMLMVAGAPEATLHSNDIDPVGASDDCISAGVSIERLSGEVTPSGVLRNNIIATGDCNKRYAVDESTESTARVVENNDLYARASAVAADIPVVLYQRNGTVATSIDEVNALKGAGKNISEDPKFVGYPSDLSLSAGSPCIDQGTPTGAPSQDGIGTSRPYGAGFDMGAYEFTSP
jgi:hypothetical protein